MATRKMTAGQRTLVERVKKRLTGPVPKAKGPEPLQDYRTVKGLNAKKVRELVEDRQALAKERDRLQTEIDGKTSTLLVMCQGAGVRALNVEDQWAVRTSTKKWRKLSDKKLLKAGVSASVLEKCWEEGESEPFVEVRGIGKKDKAGDAGPATARRQR